MDDLDPYARICADPEVMRYLSGTMTRQQTQEQISRFMRHWEERGFGLWAVEEKSSGAFIGFIGLLHQEHWPEGEHKRSEEHTSELQSRQYLVCRLLLEKKK